MALMSKAKIFLGIGVWVAILPYLGFPFTLKNILISLTGLLVIYLSYNMYQDSKKAGNKITKTFENFSENKNQTEQHAEINVKVKI